MIEIKVKVNDSYEVVFVINQEANIFEVGQAIRDVLKVATYTDNSINEILVPLQ